MMRGKHCLLCIIFLAFLFLIVRSDYDTNIDKIHSPSNETSLRAYMRGVRMGIINVDKYPFTEFLRHDQNSFRDIYKQYVSLNESLSLSYEKWLIMNNFGILPDTQESLFQLKVSKRSTEDSKRRFVNTVKKGDILITGRGVGGLVGHAAIMTSDYWVLEMKGGPGWEHGIKSNNRQISKHAWFEEHKSDWTTVYRCRNTNVAREAAAWADRNYYNPTGGSTKTKHITYKITTNVWSINPSYCSKLVIQAYYFGTGKNKVIRDLSIAGRIIVPTTIPTYFLSQYTLINKGKY